MPTTSRGVAHVNVVWPAAACTAASAVHLWALTCGRNARPGRAAAIVATLRSIAAQSATSAGVPNSEINTSAAFPETRSVCFRRAVASNEADGLGRRHAVRGRRRVVGPPGADVAQLAEARRLGRRQ